MTMDQRRGYPIPNLRKEPSNISDYSAASTSTLVPSPQSPFPHRSAYQPIAPLPEEEDISYKGAEPSPYNGNTGGTFAERSQAFGLGINVDSNRRASSARVPVGSKASPGTPGGYDPLSSVPTDVGEQQHMEGMGFPFDDDHVIRGNNPSNPSMYQSFTPNSEHEGLHKKSLSPTIRRIDPSGRSHLDGVLFRHSYHQKSSHRLSLHGSL